MKKQKKFQIAKFQIAKLSNPYKIIGGSGVGGGNDDPTTNTHDPVKPQKPIQSTVICGEG